MSEAIKTDDDPFGMLVGTKPVDESDDEPEEDPKAKAEEEPEAEDEPEETEAEESEEAEANESEDEDESKDVDVDDPQADALAEAKKREEGLRQALVDQRKKNRELMAQMNAAPLPGQFPQQPQHPGLAAQQGTAGAVPSPASAAPAGYRVEVAPDGQHVYVPQDQVLPDVERLTQQAIANERYALMTQQSEMAARAFASVDPETRSPIVEEARAADAFIEGELRNALMGGDVEMPNPALGDPILSIAQQLETAGIAEKVRQYFPRVGENFSVFLQAWAHNDPFAKREVYERMARGTEKPAPKPQKTVQRVVDAPTSMARKGGSRDDSDHGDDNREFNRLYRAFIHEPGSFSAENKKRLDALGRKLGKETFDD